MKIYIDADVLTEELENMADDVDKDFGLLDRNSQYMMERGIRIAVQYIINLAPTADVEEVKHGKWVLVKPRRKGRNATYKCTICNQLYSSYYNDVQEWTHCPCGAKMDGKENE